MQAWEADAIRSEAMYTQFLNVPDMSAGIYRLPAGGTDPQRPHSEDELYYVVSGRGAIIVGNEQRPVGPGSLVFVSAQVAHRFTGIAEDLTVLVVFGPAEYARREGA